MPFLGVLFHDDKTFIFRCRVTLIFLCTLLTDTGSLVLCEARGALAGEASDGVDAQELAVMLLRRTFIQILGRKRKHETSTPNSKEE